jgi:tetratricopeptide (TPR) repeat protein
LIEAHGLSCYHPAVLRPVAASLAFALLCASTPARATPAEVARARARYAEGQEAFLAGRYPDAFACFRDAYLLSRAPELLYDMGSALQASGRPGAAGDELRAYLRARPDDPERALIESRVRALDEAQRVLDLKLLESSRPGLRDPPATPVRWSRRRTIAVIVSAVVAGIAVGAVGVGLGLGLRPSVPSTKLGNWPVTP